MARLQQPSTSPPSSNHDYPHGPNPNGQEATLADTTSHHHEPAGLGRRRRHRTSSAETIPVPDDVHDLIIERQPADDGLDATPQRTMKEPLGWSTRLRPRKETPASESQRGPGKNGPGKKSHVVRNRRPKKSKLVQHSSKIERLFQDVEDAIQALKNEIPKVSAQNIG